MPTGLCLHPFEARGIQRTGRTIASSEAWDDCVTVGEWAHGDPNGAESHDKGGWCRMAGKTDQLKGKVKEAVAVLTGDKDLESEGKADRRAGEAKEKLDDAKDKVEEAIDKAERKAEEVIDKAKESLHRK
jgi:uncharacterized protein YjbJ (UPF0337 family)